MSINICAVSGRLTKDVESRTTQSGKSVASFTLANEGQVSCRLGYDMDGDVVPPMDWEV